MTDYIDFCDTPSWYCLDLPEKSIDSSENKDFNSDICEKNAKTCCKCHHKLLKKCLTFYSKTGKEKMLCSDCFQKVRFYIDRIINEEYEEI